MPDIDAAQRIRTVRHVTALAARDNIAAISDRVNNLLSHNRRITLVSRYTDDPGTPEVSTGLTVHAIEPWNPNGPQGIRVTLNPRLNGFSIGAHHELATEAAVTAEFHRLADRERRNMTKVRIFGGMDGDLGPGRDDRLTIWHWGEGGRCREMVVAFDYGAENDY